LVNVQAARVSAGHFDFRPLVKWSKIILSERSKTKDLCSLQDKVIPIYNILFFLYTLPLTLPLPVDRLSVLQPSNATSPFRLVSTTCQSFGPGASSGKNKRMRFPHLEGD